MSDDFTALKRRDVPPVPDGLSHYDDGRFWVFDSMEDGLPVRWRCRRWSRRVVGFIRYSYDPRKDYRGKHPWKAAWFAKSI